MGQKRDKSEMSAFSITYICFCFGMAQSLLTLAYLSWSGKQSFSDMMLITCLIGLTLAAFLFVTTWWRERNSAHP